MTRLSGVFLLFAVSFATTLYAEQAASNGKPATAAASPAGAVIALFSIEQPDQSVPQRIIDGAVARVGEVLRSSARASDVVRVPFALSSAEIALLPDWLRAIEGHGTIPSELAGVKLDGTDLSRLKSASIVVAPVVTGYVSHFSQADGYTEALQVSFAFVRPGGASPIANVEIKTIGRGLSPAAAAAEAFDQLPLELSYELQSAPGFGRRQLIVRIDRSRLQLQLGRADGVLPGDKFRVQRPGVGDIAQLIVTTVQPSLSYASVLYEKTPILPSDELRKLPVIGLESAFYLHVGQTGSTTASSTLVTVGTAELLTRGFADFRPLVGIEAPIAPSIFGSLGMPLTVYAGGQLNWRMGRAEVSPELGLGVIGLYPVAVGTSFSLSAAGGILQVGVSYLFAERSRIGLDVGYAQWLPVASGVGFGGFYGGAYLSLTY